MIEYIVDNNPNHDATGYRRPQFNPEALQLYSYKQAPQRALQLKAQARELQQKDTLTAHLIPP